MSFSLSFGHFLESDGEEKRVKAVINITQRNFERGREKEGKNLFEYLSQRERQTDREEREREEGRRLMFKMLSRKSHTQRRRELKRVSRKNCKRDR